MNTTQMLAMMSRRSRPSIPRTTSFRSLPGRSVRQGCVRPHRGLGIVLLALIASTALGGVRGRSTHRSYTLRQKLQLIVLPHVEFENTPVREAFAALQAMSKEWDADGRGVNFLLQLSKEEEARTVSLDMHRMSVEDLTRYACMSADLSHRVESSAVIVGPKGQDTTETVETRFYSINAGADLPGSKERDNKVLQDFFERTGITFPEKSSVALTPRGNKLVVTNTATNLRKLERVLVELGITTIVHTGPASGE